MKVLHLDTEKGVRGGEQQVLLLMEGLRARGVEQGLVAREGGDLAALAETAGHRVHRFPYGTIHHPFAARFVRRVVRDNGYALAHAHTGNAHTLAFGALRGGIPIIVTRRVDFAVGGNLLSRRKYTGAGVHFIAISRGVADVLRAGGVGENRIDIVASGIDANRFRGAAGRARVRAEWEVTEPGPAIGTVGSYVDHKDPLNLVRAAEILFRQDVMQSGKVVFVGEGWLRPQMEAEIASRGLQGRVVLTGWRSDVGDCLAGFDLFVMPSKLEGLSTSLVDALAVGLPCVGCRTGGIPDALADGEAGLLVPPSNPEALAEGILRLWKDADLRKQLAAVGPRIVDQRFTADSMVEGTLAVYRKAWGMRDKA